jgi:hypothetical protein
VNSTCTAVDGASSGVSSVSLPFASRCDVAFNQNVNACVPTVTNRGGTTGILNGVTSRDTSFAGIAANEVGVVFYDAAAALVGPRTFHIAVFC